MEGYIRSPLVSSVCLFSGGMRYHLLSPEDREELGESSRPRRKKHDYRIALFGGSQPQSCRYFNPKVHTQPESSPESTIYLQINTYRSTAWKHLIYIVSKMEIIK